MFVVWSRIVAVIPIRRGVCLYFVVRNIMVFFGPLTSSVLSHFSKSKLFILIYFYGYPAFALFETRNSHCAVFQHLIS